MLHLEHLNIVVSDIPGTLHFYQAAFPHWKVRGEGESDWYGTKRNWVHFGDDYQYLTFNDRGEGENRDIKGVQLGLAHFAFATSDLNGVVERLAEAGFPVDKSGANAQYRDNLYYIDPNGYEVEFVQYRSDQPEERNLYED